MPTPAASRLWRKTARLLLVGALATLPFRLPGATATARTRFPGSIRALAASGTGSARHPRLVRAQLQAAELAADQGFEVVLRLRNFDELQSRVARGEIISRAEMAARYFPLPADYARTVDWLKQQGLTITRPDPNYVAVFGHGSVAALQQALQVDFARVAVDNVEYTSAVTSPALPADLAPTVLGIHGLQPHVKPHRLVTPRPALSSASSYLPVQIAQAYGSTGLNYSGANQTIAIFGGAYPSRSDLTQFGQRASTPGDLSDRVQFVPVGTGPEASPDAGLVEEAALDVEWAAALAPGATVRLYGFDENNASGFDEAYQQVYADLTSQPGLHQLSISFGFGESEVARDYALITAQYTAMLASAGITIFAASGDTGTTVDDLTQVSLPASDPSVTGVGGTTLTFSGLTPVERAWSGSGGGASSVFARPAWQTGNGITPITGAFDPRLVPDVSAVADPNTGVLIVYNGAEVQFGGTSLSTPIWAAFCAIINEARATAGTAPLGLLNPKLYPLIGTAAFRDITSGSNNSASATAGYDRVTGLGVPNVAGLIQMLGTAGAAPVVVVQSNNRVVTLGQGTVFSVAVQGLAPLTYQWQRQPANSTAWTSLTDTATYTGTATPNLALFGATYAMNGDRFQCVVSNASGVGTSAVNSLLVNPYGVTTLAGWPQQAGSADGRGPAARFNYPGGICIDSSGTLYASDGGNSTVRKILPDGTVTTVAGSPVETGATDGPIAVARFNGVGGVAVDPAGNLYVADSGNYTIRKITPAGIVSTLAGLAGNSANVDGTGSAARFTDPENLTVDAAGNVYVADGDGQTIRKVTPAGVVTTLAGRSGLSGFADGPAASARFNQPLDVAVDGTGNLYVADFGNSRIRKITPDGTVSTLAGSGTKGNVDGAGAQAQFDSPGGLTVNASGNVYVADAFTNTIRQIAPDGTVSTLAGINGKAENIDGTLAIAQFANPADVAVDSTGLVYVADAGNNTVRRMILGTPAGPVFTLKNPPSQTVATGQDVTFTVAATGSDPLTYQWWTTTTNAPLALQNDTTFSGVNTPTLTIHAATLLLDFTTYYCVASNNVASVSSGRPVLNVYGPPLVIASPKTYYVSAGSSLFVPDATFVTTGDNQFQWFLNGVPLTGLPSSSSSIQLTNIQAANAGTYSLTVTNTYGSVTSDVATVTLSDSRVVNLSVRSIAGINDQTLIVGLVIAGSGNKTLLVRGVGPGIAQSVSNALTDPRLRLLDAQGTELEANDDWGGGTDLTTTFAALGASPLAPTSKDAAIYRTLPAGLYSFHVYPSDGVTGVALAELYDGDATPVPAEVVNISARTQVGTGDNILIAGFVITGNTPKTLLIRGQGPSLTGVSGVLADPQLYLFQGPTLVASNDNWGGTAELKAAFATVGAGALASDTSKDAALLVTLQPGLYSAQVSGVGGTTGVGQVEIFLMP